MSHDRVTEYLHCMTDRSWAEGGGATSPHVARGGVEKRQRGTRLRVRVQVKERSKVMKEGKKR